MVKIIFFKKSDLLGSRCVSQIFSESFSIIAFIWAEHNIYVDQGVENLGIACFVPIL